MALSNTNPTNSSNPARHGPTAGGPTSQHQSSPCSRAFNLPHRVSHMSTQWGVENGLCGRARFGKQSTGGTSSHANNLSTLTGVALCHGARYLDGKLLV